MQMCKKNKDYSHFYHSGETTINILMYLHTDRYIYTYVCIYSHVSTHIYIYKNEIRHILFNNELFFTQSNRDSFFKLVHINLCPFSSYTNLFGNTMINLPNPLGMNV